VPVGDVLVGDTGGNIEHDDTALAVDVVTVTETTELLLAGSIPDIEGDGTKVLIFVSGVIRERRMGGGLDRRVTYGSEAKGVNLNTKCGHILLLEFTGQMTLDEGGLDQAS
jgi:hypothetical protein